MEKPEKKWRSMFYQVLYLLIKFVDGGFESSSIMVKKGEIWGKVYP